MEDMCLHAYLLHRQYTAMLNCGVWLSLRSLLEVN